jgi:glycerol-3-phosphate dehydrogenase
VNNLLEKRGKILTTISQISYDVCVIGGGATGAGCALDAQKRGMRTLLVEANDFSCSSSSASTKMIHGGVRYLQKAIQDLDVGQYNVVRRALHERVSMIQNAPYLAKTLELVIPCYSWYQILYYALGMKIYDFISGKRVLLPTYIMKRTGLLKSVPHLKSKGLVGGVIYADGQFDDARYGLMLVQTFIEAGGEALNYTKVSSFGRSPDGRIIAAEIEDQFTGQKILVRAHAFVNATGPFSDNIRKMAWSNVMGRLRVSRGTHIVLPMGDMPIDKALLVPKTSDGRMIFLIPWLGCLLVGTTDDESTIQDDLLPRKQEVEYLLKHVNGYLNINVCRSDITSAFVGLRPLVSPRGKLATEKIIRDHEVEIETSSGLISIIGGKWTTYRAMAEDTINAVQKYLGVPVIKCQTTDLKLAGSEGFSEDLWKSLVSQYSLTAATAKHLTGKYGSRAIRVLELAAEDKVLLMHIVDGFPMIRAEIVYGTRHEKACTIADVLARRIGLQYINLLAAMQAAPIVAKYLAKEHGWSQHEEAAAIQEYNTKIELMLDHAGLRNRQEAGRQNGA